MPRSLGLLPPSATSGNAELFPEMMFRSAGKVPPMVLPGDVV